MTDRELMQQALVALGAMQSYAAAENKGLRICDEAIEALHARLAQPERKWQWLTEEEIDKILASAGSKLSAIFLVEAQLRGKNI